MYHEKAVDILETPKHHSVQLGYVEVDDMGELWDFKQLAAVNDAIKKKSRAGNGLRVVLFVHGWNNDADNSHALLRFRETLMALEDVQAAHNGRSVFGVFIGWRGRTFKSTPIGLDFFHRYQGGQRVGAGAGTDAIYEVAATARNAHPRNQVILCGHSFGGLIVENAVSQPIRARLGESRANGVTEIEAGSMVPADLIILVNEAEHAIKARQLLSALRDHRIVAEDKDLPWIVSVTSRTDGATKKLFPRGVFLGRHIPPFNLFNTSVSGRHRKEKLPGNAGLQWKAARNTAGHFQPLHSHTVVEYKDNGVEVADTLTSHIRANLKPRSDSGQILFHCNAGSFEIKRRPPEDNAFNTTPYWIMDVPKEIISRHGDIWSPRMTGLVTALIHLRNKQAADKAPPPPPAPPGDGRAGRVTLKLRSLPSP